MVGGLDGWSMFVQTEIFGQLLDEMALNLVQTFMVLILQLLRLFNLDKSGLTRGPDSGNTGTYLAINTIPFLQGQSKTMFLLDPVNPFIYRDISFSLVFLGQGQF